MFCPKCGMKNEDNARFCGECGAALIRNGVQKQPEVQKQPVVQKQPAVQKQPVKVTIPKKKITKTMGILLIEALLLLILFTCATSMIESNFGPEKVAESYFVNVVNGNYEDAYKALGLDGENEMLSEEMFANYCQQLDLDDVVNYEVIADETDLSDTAISSVVNVSYRNTGAEYSNNFQVNVLKGAEKKLFFFEDWTVGYSNILCENFTLLVCKGATVTINDVELDESYIVATEYQTEYYDTYVIPQMFNGYYDVQIILEDREAITDYIYVDYSRSYVEYNFMYYTESTAQELQELAATNMMMIYEAAVMGASFDDISSIFTTNEDYIYYIESEYDYLVERLGPDSSLDILTIEYVDGYSWTDSMQVQLQFGYFINYTYTNNWTGNTFDRESSGTDKIYFEFMKENGEWVQTNLGCESIYY